MCSLTHSSANISVVAQLQQSRFGPGQALTIAYSEISYPLVTHLLAGEEPECWEYTSQQEFPIDQVLNPDR